MSQQTILVTGGAGFIGSHITKMLHHAGYQTIVIDNLSRGNRLAVPQGLFIQGDLGDSALLHQIFEQHPIDAVMHFAAFIDVGESVRNPTQYYLNNVCHTLNLLNTMIRFSVKNFIFSSSAAIFGFPQSPLIDENHPCSPINPYGSSKWMIENILTDFDKAYGLKSCSLRYFNAAGGDPEGKLKNYQPYTTNLIPLILKGLKKDQSITINGTDYDTPDGTCVRDYIHIEDLGQAHILGMQQLLKGGISSFYNLGNGRGYSVKEVIRAVESVTGHVVKTIEGQRRPGDPPQLVANAQKALKEMKWSPHYQALETMIEHAWKALS